MKYPNVDDTKFNAAISLYEGNDKLFVSLKATRSKQYTVFEGDSINPDLPKTILRILKALRESAEQISEENMITIDELNETNKLYRTLIDDSNTTSENKQAAIDRIHEREEEIQRLEEENEAIEERMSLRDRVKAIFKKYGVTILSVVTAAGMVIGVIVSSLQKGLHG